MITLDRDESAFVTALRTADLDGGPSTSSLVAAARLDGARLRRHRRAATGAAAVASLAVVAVAGVLAHRPAGSPRSDLPIASPGTPHHSAKADHRLRDPHRAARGAVGGLPYVRSMTGPQPTRGLRTSSLGSDDASAPPSGYALLGAPGWTQSGSAGDGKIAYVDGSAEVELVWRTADGFGAKWAEGTVVGRTTLDGDDAAAYEQAGSVTVVAPPRDGWFLTLTGTSGVSVDQLLQLATQVRRQ
jgi:hypothetical protein